MHRDEPPLRDQLVEARAKIVAQLEEMHFRAGAYPGGAGGPPAYGDLIAELEDELRDIDELLDSLTR